jgi:hypothetical protein
MSVMSNTPENAEVLKIYFEYLRHKSQQKETPRLSEAELMAQAATRMFLEKFEKPNDKKNSQVQH